MKDQPCELNQIGQLVGSGVDLQMPPNILGALSLNSGRKRHKIFDHFCRDFRTRHRISPEQNVSSTNQTANVNLHMCLQKRLRSVGSLWPTVTHPMKIPHCPSLPDFPQKGYWTQANQIMRDVRGLKGFTIFTVKILGKFVPQKFGPLSKLTFLANTFFTTSSHDTAYLRKKTWHR